ncbi:uncharacterized protein [Littorina saxatilis]|uniref:uncharacterized protein n=1 Tax=Littorina saxatilis TaxID=31220 RepID=UPI0038B56B7E
MLKLLWIATEIPKSEAVRISNTMMWIFAHAFLFPFLLLVPGGVDALSWVPPGPVEEVRKYDLCEGQNLSVPWNLTTDPVENIVSIKWTWKSGATSEERELASLLPGDSVNATDSRVGHVGSAGITINNVSASDTGDIEVKVTLQNQSSQLVVTHVARLLVMVAPDVENEKLTLEVDYTPYQTKTGVSYATLRCGRFHHRGVPTVHPMIETPDGQSVSIAAHNDHEYIYPLDPGGTTVGQYRCQLPAKNLCQDANLRSNVVDVKANDIRLNKLEHLLSQLQQEHDHDKQNTQKGLKQTKQELKQAKQKQDQTKKTLEGVKRDVQKNHHTSEELGHRVNAMRCETGVVTMYTPANHFAYRGDQYITFSKSFANKPAVITSHCLIDSDGGVNLRMTMVVYALSARGFKLEAKPWADTYIFQWTVCWMACLV